MDNYRDLAKEYLTEYKKLDNKIRSLKNEYLLLEDKKERIKSSLNLATGADKGGNNHLLEVKQLDPLRKEKQLAGYIDDETRIINQIRENLILQFKIENSIYDLMKLSQKRTVILYKSIDLKTNAEISKIMEYSISQIKRYYDNGLQELGEALYKQAKKLDIVN